MVYDTATCRRRAFLFGGCRWIPVHDTRPAGRIRTMEVPGGGSGDVLAILDRLQERRFVGMACTRCGAVRLAGRGPATGAFVTAGEAEQISPLPDAR